MTGIIKENRSLFQGEVQVLTGGDAAYAVSPRAHIVCRLGVNPKPTVKVRMKETGT